MKLIFKLFFITLLFAVFSSCSNEDACDDINCLNDGTCDNGNCECILGYEGDICDIESKNKFIGMYILDSETCGNFESNTEIIEVANSLTELTQIIESNNGGTFEVSLSLDSANSFTNSSGSITGIYSDGILSVTIDGCIGTYNKQ